MNNVTFTVQETWEDAVARTPEDLSPLAVKLIHVPDLPPIDAELSLKENHYPYVVVCMTTRYTNPLHDGKLGWAPLEGETRQTISQFLHDYNLKDRWVFLSQNYL